MHHVEVRPLTLRQKLIPSHFFGVITAIIGYIVGFNISAHIAGTDSATGFNQAVLFGFIGLLIGWLAGIGAFSYPLAWVTGRRDPTHEDELHLAGEGEQGIWRYFRFTTDHKVVGIQYLVLTLFMLALGGLGAMLIRANLLTPGSRVFPTETYNTIVTMHGMLMIATMFSIIPGPFGNFILPIMIGAKDMAFPRLNALSISLLTAGVAIFLCIPFLGGMQTGWTTYAPLADQTGSGAIAFEFGVFIIMCSSALGSVNIIATIITMRAPGMTWSRLPVFVWGVLGASILSATATTSINADLLEIILDRSYNTSFFLNTVPAGAPTAGGGAAWLSENLFWFFGHPEVYLLALPAFGALLEIAPVFSRKPLFTYRLSVIGILGVTAVSFLVWGHHLFVSGWEPQLRGWYMLTTEIISIPTGFVFLAVIGTIWRGRLWMTLPMAWVIAFVYTFMIGGITGIYLSDVPADIQLHGNYFVVAHFHFVILGSALWGFFAAIYYWFPKMTGRYLDPTLGWIHFWVANIAFNGTFLTIFYLGLQGLPRRVADYAPNFDLGNTIASIFAFILGAGMILFFANVIWSWKFGEVAEANAWGGKTLEWTVPTPVPLENFEEIPVVTSGAYDYGTPPPAQPSGGPAVVQPAPNV